jgi:hypothetical protein
MRSEFSGLLYLVKIYECVEPYLLPLPSAPPPPRHKQPFMALCLIKNSENFTFAGPNHDRFITVQSYLQYVLYELTEKFAQSHEVPFMQHIFVTDISTFPHIKCEFLHSLNSRL